MPIKNPLLRRYWFEFEPPPMEDLPPGTIRLGPDSPYGCGVTAYTREDAEHLMYTRLGKFIPIPPVRRVIEDVDISTIDVLRHCRVIPVWRGVWYPLDTLHFQEP